MAEIVAPNTIPRDEFDQCDRLSPELCAAIVAGIVAASWGMIYAFWTVVEESLRWSSGG